MISLKKTGNFSRAETGQWIILNLKTNLHLLTIDINMPYRTFVNHSFVTESVYNDFVVIL